MSEEQKYEPQYTPIELLYGERNWTYTKSLNTKRPADDWADNQMTFEEAMSYGTRPFYVTSTESPIIVLDIDSPKLVKEANKNAPDDEKRQVLRATLRSLPSEIKSVIKNTYATTSVSGMGLHVFVTCSEINKSDCKRNYLKSDVGELYVNGNGTVHLRDSVEFANGILDVPLGILQAGWPKFFSDSSDGSSSRARVTSLATGKDISPGDNDAAKLNLPILVQDLEWGSENPDVVTAFNKIRTEVEYGRYEFWITIGMGLYDWGQRTGQKTAALMSFIEWSKTDPEGCDSEEELITKWNSFKEELDDSDLSYKTVYQIVKALRYDWPEPASKGDGPNFESIANLEYYLGYHKIKLYIVPGSEDIVLSANERFGNRFFGNKQEYPGFYGPYNLASFRKYLTMAMQVDGWAGLTIPKAEALIRQALADTPTFNPVRLWLDTPYDELEDKYKYGCFDPHNTSRVSEINEFDDVSNLDYIASQVELLDTTPEAYDLRRKLLKLFFCGFLKLQYPDKFKLRSDFFSRFSNNGGMLLLVGDEASYKTTFFKVLLPDALYSFCHHLPKMDSAGNNDERRFLMDLSRPGYAIMDEFEGNNKKWLNSNFKEYLTADEVSIQLKYMNSIETRARQCMIGGTSNEFKQVFSDTGTRRIWTLVVDTINTTNLVRVNWHKFYRDLKAEMEADLAKGLVPWIPDAATIQAINQANYEVKAETNTELSIRGIFNEDESYESVHDLIKTHIEEHGNLRNIVGHVYKARYLNQVAKDHHASMASLQREFENISLRLCNARRGVKYPLEHGGQGAYYQNGRIYTQRRTKPDGTLTNGNANWILPTEVSDFEYDESENID